MDDLIITRWGEHRFFLVVNAACKEQDIAHLRSGVGDTAVTVLDDRGLLALRAGDNDRAAPALESAARLAPTMSTTTP